MRRLLFVFSMGWAVACGGRTAQELGSVGAAGSSSGGAGGGASSRPPSCREELPGADFSCGASRDQDCCGSALVPGGTFMSGNDEKRPATVSPMHLDLFEVTVGRFRAFVREYDAFRPKTGQGGHPKHQDSGWDSVWETPLTYSPSSQELKKNLRCSFDLGTPKYTTWTDDPGANEHLPIACVTRHEAFAFCLWDGGRLPSEIEWNFARVGGEEQRPFPWGNEEEAARAVLVETEEGWKLPVGSRPEGRGRWGHYDLLGSRFEFVLDDCVLYEKGGCLPYAQAPWPTTCVNCLTNSKQKDSKWARVSESFYQKLVPTRYSRSLEIASEQRSEATGFRCARNID